MKVNQHFWLVRLMLFNTYGVLEITGEFTASQIIDEIRVLGAHFS